MEFSIGNMMTNWTI